jgi:hypothetical protein
VFKIEHNSSLIHINPACKNIWHKCLSQRSVRKTRSDDEGDLKMTEKIKSELISRGTAFSLLGITAALGVAVPATVLTVSDAEAQTSGMERRQERRTGRHERREERRGGGKESTGTDDKK